MIYFDNAATTKYKPDDVYDAVNYYLREVGVSPGRGSYSLGIDASRMLYQSRCTIGKYFGMYRPERVVFTKNSTEAINMFFNGFLKMRDHVVISCYEHNSVLRPLHNLKESGVIDYSVIAREDIDKSPEDIFNKYARENTTLLAMTLASNLTGRIIWKPEVFRYFQEQRITTFLDSSQGAGKLDIIMKDDGIDFLAFTGHKDLLGIPGVGGLCCQSTEKFRPLMQGGTGIHGEHYVNPDTFPEGYEAGTLNMPAIWGLQAAVRYVGAHKKNIQKAENDLMDYLLNALGSVSGIVVYDKDEKRVSTCCFTMENVPSDKVVALLDKGGICVRGGIHCAILAHEAIGTVESGAVRLSLSYQNTRAEIDSLIQLLRNVGD